MILEQLVKGIFLVLFLMTAFVASAAVRDFDRRTSELFFSAPISRIDYLTGRFAGTMVVCTLAYMVGAGALAASSVMPWLDPARVGPFRLAPYAFGLGVLIIPTLLALGAAFYALASWTRSTLATYVGVVAFFAASATAGLAVPRLETEWIGQLLDPFGVAALGGALEHWTVAELNTAIPEVGGTLLWNRILWLVLGFSALGLSVVAFDPSRARKRRDQDRGVRPKPFRRFRRRARCGRQRPAECPHEVPSSSSSCARSGARQRSSWATSRFWAFSPSASSPSSRPRALPGTCSGCRSILART